MGILQIVAMALCAFPGVEGSQIRIETSAATGLGPQDEVGRRDPSDIIRLGDKHVVLYTRVTDGSPLYPAPYAGEIWWASSSDEGHTWKERGRLLGAAGGSGGDALGVFDPNVLHVPGEGFILFYSGIGPGFNFRFEAQGRPEETQLFVAWLRWDEFKGRLSAERDLRVGAILEPSPATSLRFDSRRVRNAKPFLRNNQVHLYYRGTSSDVGKRGDALGLASGPLENLRFDRHHESRAVLPFRGDALLMDYVGGVLALFTGGDRGAWWADDGEHFAPLDVEIRGRVNSPGIFIDPARRWDGKSPRWGLHVARATPDPWLERFELRIENEIPNAIDASKPEQGRFGFVENGQSISWLRQHKILRSAAAKADTVFLGGTLVQGFATHGRDAWNKLFKNHNAASLGMRGDTTSNLLWRVDHGALPIGDQRLILIQVSSEQTLLVGDRAITRGVDTLLRRVRATKPGAKIWVITPQTTPWMTSEEVARIRSATRTLELFVPQPKVRLVNPWIEFQGEDGTLNPMLFAPYGEGLTPAGYEILAEALMLELAPVKGAR